MCSTETFLKVPPPPSSHHHHTTTTIIIIMYLAHPLHQALCLGLYMNYSITPPDDSEIGTIIIPLYKWENQESKRLRDSSKASRLLTAAYTTMWSEHRFVCFLIKVIYSLPNQPYAACFLFLSLIRIFVRSLGSILGHLGIGHKEVSFRLDSPTAFKE